MIWLSFIALLPTFVLSKSVVSADITEIQVCQYFDARIVRFEEKVKEMKECKLYLCLICNTNYLLYFSGGCGFGILQNVGSF